MVILYKIAQERTQFVLRSHSPRLVEALIDLLHGEPISDAYHAEMFSMADDMQEVLDGKCVSWTQEGHENS
jgi:hypothetical protein